MYVPTQTQPGILLQSSCIGRNVTTIEYSSSKLTMVCSPQGGEMRYVLLFHDLRLFLSCYSLNEISLCADKFCELWFANLDARGWLYLQRYFDVAACRSGQGHSQHPVSDLSHAWRSFRGTWDMAQADTIFKPCGGHVRYLWHGSWLHTWGCTSLMHLLKQRTSVVVSKTHSRWYSYLMTDNQALVEAQRSRSFSLPYNIYRLVTTDCCLIDAQLICSRPTVFALLYSLVPLDIIGN